MTYAVLLSARARRDLADLPREIIRRIDAKLIRLVENPRPPGCRKLRSRTPDGWRVRVGDYRMLYQIDDANRRVLVYRIAHSRHVYQ